MFGDAALMLLTSTAARTGQARTSPVRYLVDDHRFLIFATNAGAPTNPAWFHNVLANPAVTVETGTGTFEAKAVPVQGRERDRLYARIAAEDPAFADYERQTTRVIPVFRLERIA